LDVDQSIPKIKPYDILIEKFYPKQTIYIVHLVCEIHQPERPTAKIEVMHLEYIARKLLVTYIILVEGFFFISESHY
jgi:hypothetical protein